MTRPSNPFNYFVTGSDKEKYTHDQSVSSRAFYIVIQNECYIPVSMLVFAENESQALFRLREGLSHKLSCDEKFRRHTIDHINSKTHARFREMIDDLDLFSAGKKTKNWDIGISEFNRSHPLKVGWAANDVV
jgi:hypothetical protein